MRKHYLTIIVYFFVCLPVFSLNLTGTTWGPEKRGFGFYLTFNTNKDFKLEFSGEGGGQGVIGVYLQKHDEVILSIVTINDWGELPSYTKQKEIKCKIVETDSLFSKYKIVGSGGLELWSLKHKPADGEKCIIDGFVIYSYSTDGKVNDNARIREGPGLQYKFYSFSFNDFSEVHNSLPKGYRVKVLGHSENKTIVEGVEHSWLYCVFEKSMWDDQYCWIWGGLIDY